MDTLSEIQYPSRFESGLLFSAAFLHNIDYRIHKSL